MDEKEPLGLAILGAGTIGTIHSLCVADVPGVQVRAVWSRTFSRAQELAARVGGQAYESLEEALAAPDVDVAVICTPTFLHEPHTLAAINAGKHVICEKPLARDLKSAETIIEASQKAGVQLHVAHVVRFFPEFRRLHDLVQEGVVGQPALVRMARVAPFPRGSGGWHNQLGLSGGVVLDMGIHDLDWLLWTLGPAERVYARGLYSSPERPSYLDYGLITARFANGAMAHVEASWAEVGDFRVFGEVSGDKGLLTYDSLNSTALSVELRQPPEAPGVQVPTSYTTKSPYALQMEHFAACIRGEEDPLITPEEAFQALRLALAALEAMESNQPVAL